MPETVDIAGQKVPKTYLYAGGAAVAGIVIYAWWTGTSEPETPLMFDEFGNPVEGAPILQTGSTSDADADTNVGNVFRDNAEWSQFVIDWLSDRGYEPSLIASAIGKFLQRNTLTKAEADIVGQAVAVGGWPPIGRPWTIISGVPGPEPEPEPEPEPSPTPTPTPSGTPSIRGLRQRKQYSGGFQIDWQPVTSGHHYEIYVTEGRKGSTFAGYPDVRRIRSLLSATDRIDIRGLQRRKPYRIFVRAGKVSSSGVKRGSFSNVVAWTG